MQTGSKMRKFRHKANKLKRIPYSPYGLVLSVIVSGDTYKCLAVASIPV